MTNIFESNTLNCNFLPFYTNGGTYANSRNYFIGNLVSKESTHCTINSENVLIKYAYSPFLKFSYDTDPKTYTQDGKIYYIKEYEEQAEIDKESIPLIKEVFIKIPHGGYSCPAETLVCFSSLAKIEDFKLTEYFFNCKDHDSVLNVAKELGLESEYNNKEHFEEIVFNRWKRELQPLFWVKIKHQVDN